MILRCLNHRNRFLPVFAEVYQMHSRAMEGLQYQEMLVPQILHTAYS